MALTRKLLNGMGLTEEQIDSIIDGHTETVDALNDRIKGLEADLAGLPELKNQLEAAKQSGSEDWKGMHDQLQKDFDAYKAEVAGREEAAKVKSAYRELLKTARIDPKRIDVVLRATPLDGLKLDKDGKLEDADKLTETIKSDWSDFIQTEGTRGADVGNPGGNGGAKRTRTEIMAIKDTAERQRAIAENHEMFGF